MWRKQEGGELYTFTIITTEANALLRPIHHRMPVIMDDLAGAQWLDPVFTTSRTLSFLLQPCPSEWIEIHEVSTLVNNPAKHERNIQAILAEIKKRERRG
jgi:putative SOS response-associated peptidase YedK